MGQQQLLLLVLGIVLVGLAVVGGIQAFGENKKKTNLDLMTNDAVRLMTAVQSWKATPNALGGGKDDIDFDRVSFRQLSVPVASGSGDNSVYQTPSGTFKLKPLDVTPAISGIIQQQYGITNTGAVVAIVGLSPDREQSVLIAAFATDPSKTITITQHPFNVTVYNS